MTEDSTKSATKHILWAFASILKDLRGATPKVDEFPTLWNISALLTIASVLAQQGDTHTEVLNAIARGLPRQDRDNEHP